MPLPPFLQRNNPPPPPAAAASGHAAADDSGPVQAARTRARRRLLGAVVLLGVGIVGFPLIFETQPRQVPLDVRIDTIGSRDAAVSTADAAARPPIGAPAAPPAAPVQRADNKPAAEPARQTPRPLDELPPEPATAAAAPALPAAPAARPASAAPPPPAQTAAAEDGARAKALLDGSDAAASQAKANRFIVQVGAYSDGNALRDARQKVEKLGLKTYTQVVDSEGGQRTRVRVGPFTTRDEADRAGARLRSAGLPVAILVL